MSRDSGRETEKRARIGFNCRLDAEPDEGRAERERLEEESEAWVFFMAHTHCVEVVKNDGLHVRVFFLVETNPDASGHFQRLYFKVNDAKVLRNWVKDKLKWEVDRSSPANKLRDFLTW